MYLREGPDARPYLDLITDAQREPKLLREWHINTPFNAMIDLYKLDPELYNNWREHFVNKVYDHLYGRASEDSQGNMIPGAIGEEVCAEVSVDGMHGSTAPKIQVCSQA